MKRFSTLAISLLALSFAFTSCDDEIENSSYTVDLSKEATVKVSFFAELDNKKFGWELAPNGTEVIVSVKYDDLNLSDNVPGEWTEVVTITDGMIEVVVPTTNDGVTVEFTAAEFYKAQVQSFGANTDSINNFYKAPVASIGGVKPGQTRHQEVFYAATTPANFVETVSVKFELRATTHFERVNDYVLPETKITFFNGNYTTTATVGVDGALEVNLPKGESVTARFEANKTLQLDPTVRENYKYEINIAGFNVSEPTKNARSFGEGVKWE